MKIAVTGGSGDLGGGNWTTSETEHSGYVELSVQGPTSGNTYGAESWIRTTYDFNDGKDHVINFRWQPTFRDPHFNHYFIHYFIHYFNHYFNHYFITTGGPMDDIRLTSLVPAGG